MIDFFIVVGYCMSMMKDKNICRLCPRKCGVDRINNMGVCGVSRTPRIAKAYLHKWEEPIISGDTGSGAIFFSGCNLKCVYCQNYPVSHDAVGEDVSVERLAEIFHELESAGANNINLVTPSHYVDAIISALDIYRPNIPIVYNSSGYDSMESLKKLKDYIDIYLVDFKYYDAELSTKYSMAPDYPDIAKANILKMREYQPENVIENGIMKKGVIIRHLILPNHTDDSIKILQWIKDNVDQPFISLMGQYVPMYDASKYPQINRKLKPLEYKLVLNKMIELGLTDGYAQELCSATETYTPIWDCQGVK